jgi:hypothetical protein
MDGHEAVVEPGDGHLGVVECDPGSAVPDERADRCRYRRPVDPDVAIAEAICPGPRPDVAEHALVEPAQPQVVEHLVEGGRADGPPCVEDVRGLGFVEIASGPHPAESELLGFVVVDRRVAVFGVEQRVAHDHRPRLSM